MGLGSKCKEKRWLVGQYTSTNVRCVSMSACGQGSSSRNFISTHIRRQPPNAGHGLRLWYCYRSGHKSLLTAGASEQTNLTLYLLYTRTHIHHNTHTLITAQFIYEPECVWAPIHAWLFKSAVHSEQRSVILSKALC